MKSLEGKVFWITGASSGIGKSLAILVISRGASVVISGRNESALTSIKNQFPDKSQQIFILPFDLAEEIDSQKMVDRIVDKFGHIDFLINNGGISQRSLASETPVSVDRKVFEINFFGNISIAKAVLQQMIKQGNGNIAVTSSVVGKFGFPLRSAYAASKHALHGFYESLRSENYENNIKVTMIIPGRINTNISVNAINKEGKNHGEMDPGQAQGMSSDKAAQKILKGVLSGKKEILVGKFDLLMVHFRKFTPRLFYFLARKINPK